MRALAALLLLFAGCADARERPMAVKPRIGVRGLVTDPSALNERLDGGLLISREAVHRRAGTIEQRPGFFPTNDTDLSQVYKLLPFSLGLLNVGPDVGGAGSNTYWFESIAVLDPAGDPLSWVRDHIRGAIARKKLYLTTQDRMRSLDDSADTVASPVGVIPPAIRGVAGNGGTGSVLADGVTVTYRAVLERHHADGLIVVSQPSALHVHTNDTGGSDDPTITVTWRDAVAWNSATGVGDRLKLYRSETNEVGEADNVVMLTRDFAVDAVAGDEALLDQTEQGDLGEALYTNDDEEGEERANIRMPVCKDLAVFQESLFGCNVTDYARVRLRFNGDGLITGITNRLGTRTITGTLTNGSAVMTAVSTSFDGLEVGQVLSNATDWAGTGPVRIAALNAGASTVTFSELWNGSTGGSSVSAVDSIAVNGVYFRADTPRRLIDRLNNGAPTASGRFAASTVAFAVGVGVVEHEGAVENDVRKGVVSIEALSAATTLQITATNGASFEPPLPAHTSGTPYSIAPQAIPNAVVWSKRGKPEHGMLAAIQRVGPQTATALRVIATRDALWVLQGKGGGIWRLSGADEESGFRVDQFDPGLFLLHPELAVEHQGTIYAWTNRGAVAISDAGVIELSRPPIGNLTAEFERDFDFATYVPGTDPHAFCAVSQDGEIIWGLPIEGDDDHGAHFVYNVENIAWSNWWVGQDEISALAYDPTIKKLVYGRDDSDTTREERTSSDDTPIINADTEFFGTIDTVVGSVVTLTGAVSGWTPAAGDLIRQGAVFALIVSAASSTVFTVRDATGLAAGAVTAFQAFDFEVRWLSTAAGSPAASKRFSEVLAHFDDAFGLERWTLDLIASRAPAVTNSRQYIRSVQGSSRAEGPLDYRHLCTANENMTARLTVGLRVRQADARFAISGVTTLFEPQGTRLNP